MKKFLFPVCLAVIGTPIIFTSCQKDPEQEPGPDPVEPPTLTVEPAPAVSADGGTFSIALEVNGPAEDESFVCTEDVSWISEPSVSAGVMTFEVAANLSEEPRSGNIEVQFRYTDGVMFRPVIETVSVVQSGAPTLSVSPEEFSFGAEGGSGSFVCTVGNPTESGVLSCTCDREWVSGLECSEDGSVSFSVEANGGREVRSAVITVTYSYLSGKRTCTVTLAQDHRGGGDVSSLIGSYTAYGVVYGNGITQETEMEWAVNVYPYDGQGDYDAWFDGLVPWGEYSYYFYGDHRDSAGIYMYSETEFRVPSQTIMDIVSTNAGSTYNLGYTPCTGKSATGGYAYDQTFPDLVFTLDEETGHWVSDSGVFLAACTSDEISSMTSYFQVVLPSIVLVKKSDTPLN